MSDRAMVATRKGLIELRRANGSWRIGRVSFVGEPIATMLADPRDGTLYAALATGHFGAKFRRSGDGGETWEDLTPPTYPEPTPEELEAEQQKPQPTKWSLVQLLCLEPGSADQPGRLYAGTLPGGLFICDDHANDWRLCRELWDRPERSHWFGGGYEHPGIHSVLVDPRDDQRISIAASCGGVWTSEDGCATWSKHSKGMIARYMPPELQDSEDAQDPHLVVQSPSNPDVFWCQHHNGIFRSTNNLQSWYEIENVEPCSYGFAVQVHPEQADTAWFAPMLSDGVRTAPDGTLVVTRTDDGGKSFAQLRRGLPQEHCYDLVYRHAMALDEDGRSLLMGTTNGNLYASGDGGESWQTLSNTLAPVYAVKFG